MDAFPGLDHVLILRWLCFALGAWFLWLALNGLQRRSARNIGWISVFSGYKRWERADDPVTYWFHILLYLAFAASGLGMFAASFFIPAR